jgi:molybdopterin converting factor small subunit
MVFAAIGVGIAALGSTSLFEVKSAFGGAEGSEGSASRVSSASEAAGSGAPVTVKVVYFQMSQLVENHQEYFVLRSPANFGELLKEVTDKHPALASMTPSMMVLIDGTVAKAGTPLSDGDEVDFIPAFAGG